MMIDVWGLKSCDTCRKALAWLAAEGLPHRFLDVRATGVPAATLRAWLDELGWEVLVNMRGTTWRALPETERSGLDPVRACALILTHPAVMKRPVFDLGTRRLVGFGDEQRQVLRETR